MKTTFGSAGTSRVKKTILSSLAVLLFLAALACVIIALVKSPSSTDDGTGSGNTQTDTPDDGGSTGTQDPAPSHSKLKTVSEYTELVTFVDETDSISIEDVTDALLRQLINDASASDDTAYTITNIVSISPALFNHNQDTSSVCAAPLSANVWFVSSTAVVEHTGNLTTDSAGEIFLGGRYIVKIGKIYTLYEQADYEAMAPEDQPSFVWGEYDASTTISKNEMILSCGVKLGMTYDKVETVMGGFDIVDTTTTPRVKTTVKAGYTFTFTLIDSTNNSADDYGLPHDANYYLTYVVADTTCQDEFPRGIKIGDSIEDVFTKFPTANTKLQLWKEQRLYGAYENTAGKVYCFMEYRTSLGNYRIVAQDTGREHIAIVFTRASGEDPNKVKSFEWFLD